MIQVLTTALFDDTAFVMAEEIVLALYCNSDWSIIQNDLEHHSVLVNFFIFLYESDLIFCIDILAFVCVFAIIWVDLLERCSLLFILQVLPSVLLEATVASSAADEAFDAVDIVLL